MPISSSPRQQMKDQFQRTNEKGMGEIKRRSKITAWNQADQVDYGSTFYQPVTQDMYASSPRVSIHLCQMSRLTGSSEVREHGPQSPQQKPCTPKPWVWTFPWSSEVMDRRKPDRTQMGQTGPVFFFSCFPSLGQNKGNLWGFPGNAEVTTQGAVKNPPANAGDTGDMGSIPGSGRFPGGRHRNPLQYSCLENPMDRGAWKATVFRFAKSQT